MILTYTLDENDFLQHQLFAVTKSKRIKQQRRKSWLGISVTFLLLSLMFYQSENNIMACYFLLFGLTSVFFYPLYQKRHYKNHYQKYIIDAYKNRFGQLVNIELKNESIEINDITGETKINLQNIQNITETKDYFYLEVKTGGHLIIPKSQIANVDSLRELLKELCNKLSIEFISDLDWKWK
jgi:hypothetical protein